MRILITINIIYILNFISPAISYAADGSRTQNNSTVRLLNWWGYIDQRVINKLKKSSYKVDVSIYQSNEVALARLLSKRDSFDLAIVSNMNLNLLLKENVFDSKELLSIKEKRNYLKMIDMTNACIPYLWGTTLFAYDSRVKIKPPESLNDLVDLKKNGFQIGLLDDPLELSSRFIGDNVDGCNEKNFKNIFSKLNSCRNIILPDYKKGLSSADFLTSTDEFLLKPKVAAYGWQGSALMNLQAAPWLSVNLAKTHPVIGADYVCILKNRGTSPIEISKVSEVVKLMTDKESTKWNVESTKYFSPYQDDLSGLSGKEKELYHTLFKKMKESAPITITSPSLEEHKIINKWWKSVRYEN